MATKRNPLLDRGLKMQCDLFALPLRASGAAWKHSAYFEEGAGGTGREVQGARGQRAGGGNSKRAESGREM